MGDLQATGQKALAKAPQPLRRALGDIGVQFRDESGPTQSIASGSRSGNLAGVEQGNPNTISVIDPAAFRRAPEQLVTHEGMHLWQNNLPPALQKMIPPDDPKNPYQVASPQKIDGILNHGGNVLSLPKEQQSATMQWAQAQGMPEPYGKLAQTINDVPLSTVEMTDPMAKTINMHPRAPQVPPNTVPGMNFAKEIYQPGQPAPGDDSLLPPDMVAQPAPPMAAPVAPDPLQQGIDHDQQQLQKIHFAQANPWGTANNHPGTLGKIAHVLSVAGNIAGDIVAPNVMANIPGTQLNRQSQESGFTHRLNEEQQEQSQNNSRNASTAATQASTAAEPQAAADRHALSGAQAANLQSEVDERGKPKEPTNEFQLWRQQNPNGTAEQFNQLQSHPLSEEDAASRNAVWDTIADKYHLPKGQFRAGMSGADAAALAGALNNVIGRNQGAQSIVIKQEAADKPKTASPGEMRSERNDLLKAYQPTLDSAERMNVMTESYEKAVKDHDQQAMLNLLANHLGMTMGLQKGARMTKDIVNEAKQSQPWLQGIQSKFDRDGYLSGVTLSPNQMRQMVALGQSRYSEDAKKSRSTAQYLGAQDDGPERVPSKSTINFFLGLAHGDPNKAKQLAKEDGWTIK